MEESASGDGPEKDRPRCSTNVVFAREEVWVEGKDSPLIEKVNDEFREYSQSGNCPSIPGIAPDQILQVVVGPNHIAVLLKDGYVYRVRYEYSKIKEAETVTKEEVDTSAPASDQAPRPPSSSHQRAGPKFRRVMMAGSIGNTIGGYYRLRNVSDVRSVIIDSRRNANSSVVVPEDLVAQAQVVLQGRSRDVIVRELQRTNLNVNEAVNNLLSRDDDDDGDDITNEVLLPEELLQLLDSHTINPAVSTREVRTDQLGTSEISSTGNTNDNSNDVLDFSTSRSAIINAVKQAKSRAGRKKKEIEIEKNSLKIEQQIEQWVDTSKSTKETDTGIKFKKIAATSWNLYGISVSGQLYRWAWGKLLVQLYSGIHFDAAFAAVCAIHPKNRMRFHQHLTDIVASNIRIAVKGTGGRVLSFLDETACGLRASDALRFIGYIPPDKEQNYESLHVSDYLVAVKCGNSCLWGGLIPLADRSKIFEAETAKYRKKHVSFEDNCSDAKVLNDIREGDKVQLKSQPIYPAGSVGIFIDATKPMIGVLQKDVWKATEKSPFKITDPLAFDLEFSIKQEVQEENEQEVQGVQEGSRKRRATSHPADTGESEEIVTWGVDEVIWIHEHRRKDVATVTKMDGPYVVIDYSDESFNNRYASWKSYSIKENHPRSDLSQLQRIVRKDEVRKITSKAARNRSPKVKQSDFKVIDIDHSRKVLSIVCDPNGFRMLIKAGNHIYMSRVLITGKIFSTRRLPLFAPSLLARGPAKLLTFGDARTIYVQDGFGTLYPMLRDAVNGFREPLSVLASTGHLVATLAKPIEEVTRISTNGSFWEGMFLCVPNSTTPLHNLYLPSCTSLAQLVLFADVDGVKKFLDLMNDIREHVLPFQEYSQWMEEELCGQPLDCTSNVLHAAICQSIALVNSQNYDVEKNKPAKASTNDDRWTSSFSQIPSDEVDPQKQKEWGRILRDRTPKSDTSAKSKSDKGLKFSTIKRKSDDGDRRPGKRSLDNMTIRPEEFPVGQAYKDPQTRQKNSLAIVDLLLTHLAIIKGPSRKKAKRARTLNVSLDTTASTDTVHSDDAEMDDSRDPQSILRAMLCCKNSSGMTPFMLAVNIRAYGAASAIWTSIKKLKKKRETINMRYVFPTSDGHFNPDDSPLFVLCYNDPCSFTWTGEDHINQDIYECRTCGLTGSLCCCTECAFTCHRNHDCKQKRTAPTAYCDCWEKCKCKALIEGNDDKRKLLFMELLKHTRLYEMLNGRKEHIMLFLARTVARQIREQASSEKLKKRRHNDHHRDQGNVPEHNLEPPKFARFSLNECLKQYNVLKSAIIVGCANIGKDELMSQEEYVARIQSGSTHLDKLLFTLLSKGMADYLSLASTTLVESDVVKKRDVGYEHVVLRYVRSIVRIIALCTNLSPQAACAVITQKVNEQQSTTSKKDENRIRIMSAIGFSGLLPMFKKEAKVDKALGIAELMVRAIGTLKMLSAPAALELCAAADAILAPVRIGMVRKLSNPVVTGNHDPLEILEKYFATEKSLSEVLDLKKMELHDSVRTKRKSRGAGAAEDHAENHSDGRDSGDDGGSDNEAVGDVTVSSRHRGDSTGGGTVGTARRHPPAVEEVEMAERSFGDDGSSSSSDSEDDDERDDDDVDEEEENADGAESNFRLFQSDMYEMEEEERDGENDDWGMESSSSEGDGDQNDEDRQDSDHDQDDDQMEDEEENDAQEDQGDAERQGAEPQEQEEQPVEAIHLPPPAIRRRVFGSFDDDDGPNENHEPDEQRNAVEAALDAAVEQHEEDGAILGDFLERQHSVAARFGRGEGLPADLTSSGHSTSNMNPAELPSRDTGTSNTREVRGSAIFTGFRRYNRQSSSNTSASTSEPTESNEDASNTRSSTTAPAVSVAVTTTTSGASSKKSPVPTPDPNNLPSKLQAEQQLSMTFSVLVRIAVDILLNKMLDETSSNTKRTSFKTILDLCEQLLSDSFRWLVKVLDHTENTLRFLAGRRPTKAAKKEKDSPTSPSTTSSKKDKDDSPVSAAANRKVTLGYIASVLRSVRDENADTKLQLDDEILPSMAMVLDAYFVFVTSVSPNFEEWKIRLDQFSNPLYRATDKRNFVDRDILTQFFQRGKDQFDPILLLTGEWDSTQPTVPVEKQIPLISNPSVLQMEATQRDLFHNPENQVKLTHSQHVRNLTLLGVPSESRASMALTNHSSIITSTLKAYNNAPVADEPIYEEEPAPECPEGFEKCSLEELREGMRLVFGSDSGRMRMRWEKSIEYMSEMTYSTMTSYFGDCMPLSFSPLVAYVSRFSIRHELFSRTLEKFRVSHGMAKEISLDVERDPTKMMTETIRQINTIYARRICSMPPANLDHKTPLACARLRVKFHSEPGEGTGVTRSFYTAFAEVCSSRKSPFSGLCESASNSLEMIAMLPNGPEAKEKRERVMKDKLTEMIDVVNKSRDIFIDINAAPYDPIAEKEAHEAQPDGDRNAEKMYISVPATLTMYKKLLEICDNKNDLASRIMGIMFNFPVKVFTECSQNDDSLRLYVTDIKNRLTIAGVIGFEEDINSVRVRADSPSSNRKHQPGRLMSDDEDEDTAMTTQPSGVAQEVVISSASTLRSDADPLFNRSSKGFLSPEVGNGSPLRLNAFRNIGRIIGICLSHGDIFPLNLSRHVFKYILRQPIRWIDLAFYDPEIFNHLVLTMNSGSEISTFYLGFSTDSVTDNGTLKHEDLKPNGENIPVDDTNVVEYVYRTAENKMLGKNTLALEALRDGVLDVIPENILSGLTAEDLRLMMCGVDEVNIPVLKANTVFLDESRAPAATLAKFKEMFWQVIEAFSPQEKQDLIFFWTGAPTLQASGDWQNNATVMMRPSDDQYLPTANTCISRIYVPVYSSKKILKSKLTLAIKSKVFGFV